jgi:transcriptional regulator NrdR family protein
MDDLMVEKRSGGTEPFNRSKILASVSNAGAAPEQADLVATGVEAWAQAAGGTVKAVDIRNKVLELLGPLNPQAAEAYERYKKTE